MSRTDDKYPHRGRTRALGVLILALTLSACGSPTIVNTGEPWTPAPTSAPPAQLPEHASNRVLADASEFFAPAQTPKVYRFATPSGRWQCEIVPHTSAGCRPAASATLSIAGAPTSVPGIDGEPTTPDSIIIDRSSEVRFVGTGTGSGLPTTTTAEPEAATPVATLPFGKVLQVAGFRCNVQELTGVSCGSESSGKGFTFSSDGYTTVYTDVPQ